MRDILCKKYVHTMRGFSRQCASVNCSYLHSSKAKQLLTNNARISKSTSFSEIVDVDIAHVTSGESNLSVFCMKVFKQKCRFKNSRECVQDNLHHQKLRRTTCGRWQILCIPTDVKPIRMYEIPVERQEFRTRT